MLDYKVQVTWTGDNGQSTASYTSYERSHIIKIEGKPDLEGSADAPFRGDVTKHNPEDLLVSALSACHMLWYLHLCADAGVLVKSYVDHATGTLQLSPDTPGHFTNVVLAPVVVVADPATLEKAHQLHHEAHSKCFIANSVNFPVLHHPRTFSGI